MKVSDNTSISMPMRNLISIVMAVGVGVWAYFGIVERLNKIETELQLMHQDLSAASEFIDGVPKGKMVSPEINELYMLVEFLSTNQEKLKENVEADMPQIQKVDMQVQFLEERIIDLETLVDKLRNNGTHQ
jgi:predicted RNase H-like nuclease (RuvC/YqgF family)